MSWAKTTSVLPYVAPPPPPKSLALAVHRKRPALTPQLDYAHAAAPSVRLYINDYNIESVNNKSAALVALAQTLLDGGHPLHGIGFESHFIGGSTPTDIAASMKQFTDLGLDVAITELDVRVPVNNQGVTNSTWLGIQ